MLEETLRYLGIAFVSSALLIVLSKIILQHLIRRPADYYNAAEIYQEELMLNSAGFSIREEIETNPEGELTDEKIDVEPQISVEEAVSMHLAVPEELLETEELPSDVHDDGSGDGPAVFDIEPDVTAVIQYAGTDDEGGSGEAAAVSPASEEAEAAPEDSRNLDTGESFADIRRSLEEAYRKSQEEQAGADVSSESSEETASGSDAGDTELKEYVEPERPKKERRRKPSMNMKKAELTEIALSMGIELPDKATKRIILDLINDRQER